MFSSLLDIHILVYALFMSGYVAFAHLLSTRIPFFSGLITEKLSNRSFEGHLEGLRGILALNVFFHHAAYSWQWLKLGSLSKPDSHFMDMLGGASVALFFFLSGYLFWTTFLKQDPSKFSIKRFYLLRFLRIAPLYWFFCVVLLLVVIGKTGFELEVPLSDLIIQFAQWLLVGVPLGHFPDINSLEQTRLINIDSTWSLRHEVMFYLLIPFLLPFAKGRKTWLLMVLFICLYLVGYLLNKLAIRSMGSTGEATQIMTSLLIVLQDGVLEFSKFLLIGFAPGMLCAYLRQLKSTQILFARLPGSGARALIAVSVLVLLLNSNPDLMFLRLVPLWVVFVLITCTNAGSRFLQSRGLVLLGLVSFSVYLLHGIFLYALVPTGFNLYAMFFELSPITFWLTAGLVGLLVISCSAVVFRYIEYPGIERGKRAG